MSDILRHLLRKLSFIFPIRPSRILQGFSAYQRQVPFAPTRDTQEAGARTRRKKAREARRHRELLSVGHRGYRV